MRSRWILAALLLAACGRLNEVTDPGGGGGEPVDPTATLTRVRNEIFVPSCALAGCHGAIGAQSELQLTPAAAYANLVGRNSVEMPQLLRVAPGDPANSYLYRKVTGAGITGERMPLGLPPLNDAQLRLVRDWIRRGAPND
jgi:hypothetical protein